MLVCVKPEPHSFFFFCKTVKTGSSQKQNFRVLRGKKKAGYSKAISEESLKKVCNRYCEDSETPRILAIKPKDRLLSINGKSMSAEIQTIAVAVRSWTGIEDVPITIMLHEQEKVVVMHNLFTGGVVCLLGFKDPLGIVELLFKDDDLLNMIDPR